LHKVQKSGKEIIVEPLDTSARSGGATIINTHCRHITEKTIQAHFLRTQRMESISTLSWHRPRLNNVLAPIDVRQLLQMNISAERVSDC